MFIGFNVEIDNDYNEYRDTGKRIFDQQKKLVVEKLNYFTDSNDVIDGKKLQENWFPNIKADIFLSHSHKDENMALGLAGWLYEKMGLTAFIDSQVWGYAGDLLKIIDDKYCRNVDLGTYNYEKRNFSTSHVHIMLSTALSKMMDNTECLFFLNTSNSVSNAEEVIESQTESSWIYHEIAMMDLIRRKNPEEHREDLQKRAEESNQLRIKYSLDLDKLPTLNDSDLKIATVKAQMYSEYGLDAIYRDLETS